MADVGELKAKIKIDTSDAEKKLKGIKKDFKNTGEAVEKSSRTMSESVYFSLGAVEKAVKFVSWGYKQLDKGFQSAIQTAERIDKTKFFSGVSAENFQNLNTALKSVNVEFSTFEDTFKNIDNFLYRARNFGEVNPMTKMLWDKLGINPLEYENTLDLIKDAGEALLKKNPQERRNIAGGIGFNQDFLWALDQGNIKLHKALNLTNEQVESHRKLAKQIANNSALLDKILQQISDRWNKPLKELGVNAWGAFLTMIEGWLDPKENKIGKINFSDYMEYSEHGFKKLSDPQKKVFFNIEKELRKAGVNDTGIAAVLGNAFAESSFNPTNINGSHTGLFQWDKSRWSNLLGFAKERGMSPYSEITQTQFLISEMKKRGVFGDIANAKNLKDAVELFEEKIEVSKGQAMKNRFGGAISASTMLNPTDNDFASPLDAFSSSNNSTVINDNHSIVTINTSNETGYELFDIMKQEKVTATGGI